MKLLVVGGVAGGMVAATRARRLSRSAQIIVFERGRDLSYGACGMPYYIGREIEERSDLEFLSPELLVNRYDLDVRPRNEVIKINRKIKSVTVHDLDADRIYEESYDKLVLSPGALPAKLQVPGADLPGIWALRSMQEMDAIKSIVDKGIKQVVLIGAGFIGMEMVENLHRLGGIDITVVQLVGQIMPAFDREMARLIEKELIKKGIHLRLDNEVQAFIQNEDGIEVKLKEGPPLQAQLVIVGIGVRPENRLAVESGLAIGFRGGVKVNEWMQTTDPDIYAVGDVVENQDFITGYPTQILLAGPGLRQARIAADHIFGRRDTPFRGIQGTAIVRVFDMIAAVTGLSEKKLRRINRPYLKVYVHPIQHVKYYPNVQQMTIKILFEPHSGKLFGAQIVGGEGVDKRIDTLSVAIQAGMTVCDLEEMEFAYAPPYNTPRDPVNFAGFVASNLLRGDQPCIHIEDLDSNVVLVDVRTREEFAEGFIPGAINIPIDELRGRLNELPKTGKIHAYCAVGQRGYLATRILRHLGYDAENLSGGYKTYKMFFD